VPRFPLHRLRGELEQTSALLDALPVAVLGAVHGDLVAAGDHTDQRSEVMLAVQVLRAMAIKQLTGWSYDELAFQLQDSSTLRRFCRLGAGDSLSESMLQTSIECITPQTWERVNRHLVEHARQQGIELDKRLRTAWK
jgi:hypothetical protein